MRIISGGFREAKKHMAELLYRLGKLAARRAWIVIVAWVLVIVVAAVGFAVGFKGLSSSFDIPGTASGSRHR